MGGSGTEEVKLAVEISEYEMFSGRRPPRFYGLTFIPMNRDARVYHPVPLNYVIRFWRAQQIAWFYFWSKR